MGYSMISGENYTFRRLNIRRVAFMEVEVKSDACNISGVNRSGNSLQAYSYSEF